MKKPIQRKINLVLASSLCVLILASLTVSTMAWFASKRTATINMLNISVDGSYSYVFKYFAGNYDSEAASYSGYNDYRSLRDKTTATKVSDYSDETLDDKAGFITLNDFTFDSNGPLNISNLFPNVCHTFALEVTSASHNTNTLNLYLKDFLSTASSDRKIYNSALEDPYTGEGVQLASAISVYTKAFVKSDNTTNTTAANAFITTDTENIVESSDDKFTYYDYTTPSQNYTLYSGTIAYNTTVVILFTIEFSNDASTYYQYKELHDGAYYFARSSASGSGSNAYQGLGFQITDLLISQ